jgi:hypothetical protein
MDSGAGGTVNNAPTYILLVTEFGFPSLVHGDLDFPGDGKEGWTEMRPYIVPPCDLPAHRHLVTRRHPNTGRWLIDSPVFRTWTNTPNTNLFCHGIPGVGKSTLMSLVVDDICAMVGPDTTTVVACLYDAHTYADDPGDVARGAHRWAQLLGQVVVAALSLPDAGQQPLPLRFPPGARVFVQNGVIMDYLGRLLSRFRRAFLILDGMPGLCPGCDPGSRQLGQLVSALQAPGSGTMVNVLATSRSVDSFRFQYMLGRVDSILETRALRQDVAAFLHTALGWLPPQPQREGTLAEAIKQVIWENSHGV